MQRWRDCFGVNTVKKHHESMTLPLAKSKNVYLVPWFAISSMHNGCSTDADDLFNLIIVGWVRPWRFRSRWRSGSRGIVRRWSRWRRRCGTWCWCSCCCSWGRGWASVRPTVVIRHLRSLQNKIKSQIRQQRSMNDTIKNQGGGIV